jgi:hypothetical protein
MYKPTIPEIITASANFEWDWFNEKSGKDQEAIFKEIMIHGFKGFKNCDSKELYQKAFDIGMVNDPIE